MTTNDPVFGPRYAVPLPPLHIDIRPDESVDPEAWRDFRDAATQAVYDLFEEHGLAARVEDGAA